MGDAQRNVHSVNQIETSFAQVVLEEISKDSATGKVSEIELRLFHCNGREIYRGHIPAGAVKNTHLVTRAATGDQYFAR